MGGRAALAVLAATLISVAVVDAQVKTSFTAGRSEGNMPTPCHPGENYPWIKLKGKGEARRWAAQSRRVYTTGLDAGLSAGVCDSNIVTRLNPAPSDVLF
jgi:hypothetical protein